MPYSDYPCLKALADFRLKPLNGLVKPPATCVPVLGTKWRGSYDVFMKTIHTAGYRALLAWLREQRLARGLSMRELARRLGIAHSWVGKIETGEHRLDVCEYIHLCQALECDYRDGIRRLLDRQ